jgi:hypothetical protein
MTSGSADQPMGRAAYALAYGDHYKQTILIAYVAGVALAIGGVLGTWWGLLVMAGLSGASGWLLWEATLRRPDTFLWDEEELSVVTWLPGAVIGLYAGYLLSGGGWAWAAGVGLGLGVIVMLVVSGVRAHHEANAGFIDWHLIPYRWRRRRPLHMWSDEQLRAHVIRTWAASPRGGVDFEAVPAVFLVHQDPGRLPAGMVRRAQARGLFAPWLVLSYLADDHNLVGAEYGYLEDMLYASEGFISQEEAERAAKRRAKELGARRLDWVDAPGLLRAALLRDLRRG